MNIWPAVAKAIKTALPYVRAVKSVSSLNAVPYRGVKR